MAHLGKKILSAFVDNGNEQPLPTSQNQPDNTATPGDQRFTDHFDRIFDEANIPGPDYYEFARMIVAMRTIADERSGYTAAFAGLQAQGLDKDRLLSTAGEYLRVLGEDADAFQKSVDSALQEKVQNRAAEAEEKNRRIQSLSQEITGLQTQIAEMQNEIRKNREKLESSRKAYIAESERRRQQVQTDIEKIKHYLP